MRASCERSRQTSVKPTGWLGDWVGLLAPQKATPSGSKCCVPVALVTKPSEGVRGEELQGQVSLDRMHQKNAEAYGSNKCSENLEHGATIPDFAN